MKSRLLVLSILSILYSFGVSAQTTVTLSPSQDNTIADQTPNNSNGKGSHFFAGRTNNGKIFRALILFDVSSIPSDATITEASLTINVNRARGGNSSLSIHKLNNSWGEGDSDAAGNEGRLASAAANDVTWNSRFTGTSDNWTTPGGDFNSSASASVSAGNSGNATFTGNALISDVQEWINNSNNNFGWILRGEENSGRTAKRFTSKDGSGTGPQLTITYTVPVTNQAPTISAQTFSIAENSGNGVTVGTVAASDPDGDNVTYSITAGNTSNTFSIDNSGSLTVIDNALLDFETTQQFNLTVQVSDGSENASATVTVNVTNVNEQPTIAAQTFSVAENSPAATSVGSISGSDPDNDNLSFSIQSGNTNNTFSLSTSGELTVNETSALDFETTQTFNLSVQVSDGSLTANADITVNVTNVNEAPSITSQTFSIAENSPNDTILGTVQATDSENDNLVFSIADGNTGNAFKMSSSGELAVNNATQIDFETTPQYQLTISVSDGNLSSNAQITINVTDVEENNSPSIANQSFSIAENNQQGTAVGNIVATDPNGDNLTFEVIAGNDANAFTVSTSGLITVNDASQLNFEVNPQFVLTVKVSDGGNEASAQVTIEVTDVNESPTVANQSFSVDENSTDGTTIGSVNAADPDNNNLAFTILSGNDENIFTLTSSGTLSVNDGAKLDFETTQQYTLNVQTSDSEFSVNADVTISVNNLNEAPTLTEASFAIDENSSNGTEVGTLQASDPENDNLTFSIESGNTGDVFAISNAGIISVNESSQLDFETTNGFTLNVKVSDGSLEATANVTVSLNNVNEVPIITPQTFTIAENSANGTEVGQLLASDPENDNLTFTLVDGNTGDAFTISSSGLITVKDSTVLDFESITSFTLTIQVSDGTLSANSSVTINLTDEDEIITSLPEFPENTLQIFPNPSNTDFSIFYQNINSSGLSIDIFNSLGQSIESKSYVLGIENGVIQVSSSGWGAGLYLIKISNNERSQTIRFMKE